MRYWTALSILVVAFAVVGCSQSRLADYDDKDGKDERITMDQVPAPAQATLLKAVGNGKITGVDREDDDSRVEFSADAVIDGKKYEVKVDADGTLVSKKLDDDHE